MIEHLQSLAFFSAPGTGEWMVILLLGLLIFGRKLPEVARNLGKSVNEFKRGLRDFQDSADEVIRDVNNAKADIISQAEDAAGLSDFRSSDMNATASPAALPGSHDEAPDPATQDQPEAPTGPPP
jgi:sec-independent protein translocase protein TatA